MAVDDTEGRVWMVRATDGRQAPEPVTLAKIRRGIELGKLQVDMEVSRVGEGRWETILALLSRLQPIPKADESALFNALTADAPDPDMAPSAVAAPPVAAAPIAPPAVPSPVAAATAPPYGAPWVEPASHYYAPAYAPARAPVYRVIPFNASIGSGQGAAAAAQQLEALVAQMAQNGLHYVGCESIPTFVAGGCFSQSTTRVYSVVIFRT